MIAKVLDNWVDVLAASRWLGVSRTTVQNWCRDGRLKSRKVKRAGRLVVLIDPNSLRSDFERLLEEWFIECRAGVHKAKAKPLDDDTLRSYELGLRRYFEYLGTERQYLEDLSAENLKLVFLAIDQQTSEERDWFGLRHCIFNAVYQFSRWLVWKGHLVIDLDALKAMKPARKLPPRQPILYPRDMDKLMLANKFDKALNRNKATSLAILGVAAYAGLRRNEIVRLKTGDVDQANQVIYVHDGKGHKSRMVPIGPTLAWILKRYWHYRSRIKKPSELFFVSLRGSQLTGSGVYGRVISMGRKAGLDITAHSLRRHAANYYSSIGCTIEQIRDILGHSNVSVTDRYLIADWHEAATKVRQAAPQGALAEAVRPPRWAGGRGD